MELALWALGGLGVVAASAPRLKRSLRHRRSERARPRAELDAVRQLAEADAVLLGEELARLDARTTGMELSDEAAADYQVALEAYEAALQAVDRLKDTDDISQVVDTLAAGRYAAVCVVARLQGAPLPAFRVPCFFDPRHGPAATEVVWNAPGRGSRKVPACAQDAARHGAGDEPSVTTVTINGREVPYWAAGGLSQPYEDGYVPRTPREAIIDHKASYSLYDNPTSRLEGPWS